MIKIKNKTDKTIELNFFDKDGNFFVKVKPGTIYSYPGSIGHDDSNIFKNLNVGVTRGMLDKNLAYEISTRHGVIKSGLIEDPTAYKLVDKKLEEDMVIIEFTTRIPTDGASDSNYETTEVAPGGTNWRNYTILTNPNNS
jgi:hypothetical protein